MLGWPTKRRRLRSRVQLSRDRAGRFGWNLHGKTARSALYLTVKVAGGGPSVPACAVFFRAKSRDGDKFNQTPDSGQPLRVSLQALQRKPRARGPGAGPQAAEEELLHPPIRYIITVQLHNACDV